jgi:hypothetical protein
VLFDRNPRRITIHTAESRGRAREPPAF